MCGSDAAAVRKIVDDALKVGKRAVLLDVCAVNVGYGCEIDFVVFDGNAVHLRSVGDDGLLVGFAVSIRIAQHDNVADRAARHVNRAVLSDGHHARIDQILRENIDLESVRQGECIQCVLAELGLRRFHHVPREFHVGRRFHLLSLGIGQRRG